MKAKPNTSDKQEPDPVAKWMGIVAELLGHINKRLDSMEEKIWPDPAKTLFNRVQEQQRKKGGSSNAH